MPPNPIPEGLPTSERELRLIVDTIPGLVAIMTARGEVELVNQQVLDYFGRTLDELKQWGTSDAVHPDDLPAVIAAWTRSVETGAPYEFEHRIRRADGVYRWFQSRGHPLRDAEGRVVRWYNLLTDIDERKQAEEALQQEPACWKRSEHSSNSGSWRCTIYVTGRAAVSPPRCCGISECCRLHTGDESQFFFKNCTPRTIAGPCRSYETAQASEHDFDRRLADPAARRHLDLGTCNNVSPSRAPTHAGEVLMALSGTSQIEITEDKLRRAASWRKRSKKSSD